jgi:hypothetical protein
MGACYNSARFKDGARQQVLKEWASAVECSQWDDGHSYSGQIGMLDLDPVFVTQVFASADEADDYVEKTHEKWERPLACRYQTKEGEAGWVIGGWCPS